MRRGGAAFFVRTPAPRGKDFGHGGGGRGGGVGCGLRRGARDVASPARRFARRRRGVGRRRPGARACVRRLSDGSAPRFAQRRGAPRRAVSADELHRWRGTRVKLLTEATCLQDAVFRTWSAIYCAVARRRGDVPVELSRDVRAPVVRATTSFSSKMEVASSPENRNPHAKKDKICAGYLVSEPLGHAGTR